MSVVIVLANGYARGLDRPVSAKCRKSSPLPIELVFEPEVGSEEALYRAVLLQVVTDIASKDQKTGHRKCKEEAELWLQSSMFEQVCVAAGWTADYVRSRIEFARHNDFQWRAA